MIVSVVLRLGFWLIKSCSRSIALVVWFIKIWHTAMLLVATKDAGLILRTFLNCSIAWLYCSSKMQVNAEFK